MVIYTRLSYLKLRMYFFYFLLFCSDDELYGNLMNLGLLRIAPRIVILKQSVAKLDWWLACGPKGPIIESRFQSDIFLLNVSIAGFCK